MTLRDIPSYEELNPHLKALADIGMDGNILCYDPGGKPGVFTDRLMVVTINAMTLAHGEKLDAIIHDDSGVIHSYLEPKGLRMPLDKIMLALFISNSNVVLAAY